MSASLRRWAAVMATLVPAMAAGTAAAAPWSAPQDVGPAGATLAPTLAFAPDGNGLAGWNAHVNVPLGPPPANFIGDTGRVMRLTQGDGFGEVRALPDTLVAGPALDDQGRGVILRSAPVPQDRLGRVRFSWSQVNAAGAVGAARSLGTVALAGAPAVAVDARGDALVAWVERGRSEALTGRLTVKGAWRRAGAARFGTPKTLFESQDIYVDTPGAVVVALNRAGRGIVAFADAHETRLGVRRKMYAWTARAGRPFGSTLTAGAHDGIVEAAAVVDARGRATLVWGSQDAGIEAGHPWVVRATSLAPGAAKWGAVQVLDDGGGAVNRPWGNVAAAVDASGRVTAAWSGVRRASAPLGFVFPVFTATADAGRFGAVQQLAPSGSVGGVAARPDGTVIVAWAHVVQYQRTDQAQAAVRGAGATAFGPVEDLAAPDGAGWPGVAFDPRTGAPVAAWASAPPSTSANPPAPVLRVATRSAP
jgi:hypothetical protein